MTEQVLFDLIFYVQVNNFSVMLGQIFLGLSSTKQGLMYLAQGHNAVMPVRLQHATPQSRDKHSTTEPLRSRVTEHVNELYNVTKMLMNYTM